ncbi:MAG: hypothetical protein WBC06_14510 [Chitinophagaceae bacterium]
MKKIILFAVFVFTTATLFGQTKTFTGAWFEIKYPSTFTPRPSLKSATSQQGYESAFFKSADGLVEFYIYAPQWSGNPTDIALKNTEKTSGATSKTSGSVTIKWWTITAKNGSYTRTYQETRDNVSNTKWVVGIKYKNQTAYNKYKQQYIAFKASLIQFGD